MNGISPLPASLQEEVTDHVSEAGAGAGEGKNGVKRPSQDEGQEAPDQKKTNIDVDDNVPEVGYEQKEQEVDVGENVNEAGVNDGDLEENVFMTTTASLLQELPQSSYMLPTSGIDNVQTKVAMS